jgi:vacuolar-type H+-ATPase subunit H
VRAHVDVQKKLDEIVEAVGSARSMPMSASCVVNRAELLALLDEVRQALPGSLAHAEELIGGRDRMVDEARREAERIIESAHAHRGSLVSDTEVARRSRAEAERILDEARREAAEVRAEADDYVDSKLANFEVVLTKTLGSVERGREKLLRHEPDFDGGGHGSADEYISAKLGAFEAVLGKTLEAVGRGRQKLLGRLPADDLGAHMAAQDAADGPRTATSDADFLAGLAEPAPAIPAQSHAEPAPAGYPAPGDPYADFPAYPQASPQPAGASDGGYGYQDPYGYPQTAPQDPYGYPAPQDPYAASAGYPGAADGYPDYSGQGGHTGPTGHADPYAAQPQAHAARPAALDETSFFDTGMIDLDRVRAYEQGR